MCRIVFLLLCMLSVLFCMAGCSTVMNVTGNYFFHGPTDEYATPPPNRIYGGARHAGKMGWDYVHYTSPDGAELFALPFGLWIWALDFPFSLIGDTLTLPWTIPAQIERDIKAYYFPDPDKNHPAE